MIFSAKIFNLYSVLQSENWWQKTLNLFCIRIWFLFLAFIVRKVFINIFTKDFIIGFKTTFSSVRLKGTIVAQHKEGNKQGNLRISCMCCTEPLFGHISQNGIFSVIWLQFNWNSVLYFLLQQKIWEISLISFFVFKTWTEFREWNYICFEFRNKWYEN